MSFDIQSSLDSDRFNGCSSFVDSRFYIVFKEFDEICYLERHEFFDILLFYNAFMYWNISLVGDAVSPEKIISC